MPDQIQGTVTEHQEAWWGEQACMACNPHRLNTSRPAEYLPDCDSCGGTGWTVWASLATEPWSEVIHNLWIGGHDYVDATQGNRLVTVSPQNVFDVIVSMYSRPGFEPGGRVEHHECLVADGELSDQALTSIGGVATLVADRVREGKSVLSRCQAGLNRSSLVAGLAMIHLGYEGHDVVQLIRRARSPWALCNPYFVEILENMSARDLTILANSK